MTFFTASPTMTTTTDPNDISLTPAQRRVAARACFGGAASALLASMAALLPLWTCPLAAHLPLLRVVLFLLGVCQLAGIVTAGVLWRRVGRQAAVSAARAATTFESLFVAQTAGLPTDEFFASVEAPPTATATTPGRWWTDAGIRQETRHQRVGR